MPRGPAAHSARDAILAAALDLFSERGYEATTIDDVRQQSGASTGSIYHHFGSKEALAAALFLHGLSEYQRAVLPAYAAEAGAEDGVRETVCLYLQWVAEHRRLARFLLTSREPDVRTASDPEMAELNQRFFSARDDWRRRHVASGALRALPSEVFRAIVLGPAEAFARGWLDDRFDTPIDEAMDQLADAAWLAVRGPSSD